MTEKEGEVRVEMVAEEAEVVMVEGEVAVEIGEREIAEAGVETERETVAEVETGNGIEAVTDIREIEIDEGAHLMKFLMKIWPMSQS